jgi:hypothetical protein
MQGKKIVEKINFPDSFDVWLLYIIYIIQYSSTVCMYSIIILSWHKSQTSKTIVMFSWLFGHMYIGGETVQMNSCTDRIHVLDMKQKKNHHASNTVHISKALLITSERHPSLSHTSILRPHLFCVVLIVALCLQLSVSCYYITSKQPYLQRNAYLCVLWKLQGSTLHVFLSLLLGDSKVFLPWAESGQCLNFTIYFHLVPRLRMSGALPPPYMPSLYGQGKLAFAVTVDVHAH